MLRFCTRGAQRGGKHALEHSDIYSEDCRFWIVVFRRERCSNRANGAPDVDVHVLLHVRAYGDSPVSLLHRPKCTQKRDTHRVVPNIGGLRPRPFVMRTGAQTNQIRQDNAVEVHVC